MILFLEGATKAQESEAESIIGVLTTAYPGYPWAVRVYDGGFFIRNLDFPAQWGMNCKYKNISHDAAVMKKQIIMYAGEWLERAGLRRGRANDDEIKRLEGAPEKHQPKSAKAPIDLDSAVKIAEAEVAKAYKITGGHINTSDSIGAALREKQATH